MPDSPTDELEDQGGVDNLHDENANLNDQADIQDDSNPADTSTAEDAEKPSMLDAISAALKPEGEQSSGSGDDEDAKAAAAAAAGESKDEPKAADDDDLGEITDEELKGYHSKTRRRVKQLMGKAKAFEEENKSLKPTAERMAAIDKFVEEHGLSKDNMSTVFEGAVRIKNGGLTDEDFKTGVEIMVAVNNDPQKAYDLLLPLMESLAIATGDILSPALQAQVDEGKITEEAARELSRLKAGQAITTTRQTQTAERTKTEAAEREAAARSEMGNAVGTAVTNWEKSWQSRDPDYGHKAPLWADKMKLFRAAILAGEEPMPADAKAFIAKAEQFKKEVETHLRKALPSRKPVNPTPHGVGTSTGSKAAPASLKEAISNALNQ